MTIFLTNRSIIDQITDEDSAQRASDLNFLIKDLLIQARITNAYLSNITDEQFDESDSNVES